MKAASSIELEFYEEDSSPPEVKLWAAVLHLAILDATPYILGLSETTYEQRRHGVAALNWLSSNFCRHGSFVWVCDLIGVDCQQVRLNIGMNTDKSW